MEQRIDQLERLLIDHSGHDQRSSATHVVSPRPANDVHLETTEVREAVTASTRTEPEPAGKVALNFSCSLGAFPASSITSPVHDGPEAHSALYPDLIHRAVISSESARESFTFYRRNLDPYMHYELAEIESLQFVRARSSLLTAAICTVATFCTNSRDYQGCLQSFQAEVSNKLFAEHYDFDDVRALCIGARWLTDISTSLNGLGEAETTAIH